MLGGGAGTTGTVSDLAPGMKDDMRMLEAKAAEMAKPKTNVTFVRGDTQSKEVEAAAREPTVNPDEINIDDDDDEESSESDEEAQQVRKIGGVEQQAVPSQVFGSLKKDEEEED
jgi:pre-mRNA-splicing factor SYF1